MQLSDFDFKLPPSLVARYPLPARSASRLLCVDKTNGDMTHKQFKDINNLLQPGDLLVFNDTRVIPARLMGQKSTGGQVELLAERIMDEKRMLAQIRASKAPRIGEQLSFANNVVLEVTGRQQQFYEVTYQGNDKSILAVVESIGHIPLPPYMNRTPDENDKERYQTVYAQHKGSVAAPTAGLHFDVELLHHLREKKVQMGYLTLHIGAGTFQPVRVDNITQHAMHSERLEVSMTLCGQIAKTKAEGKRVIAVGTTSLRALETASQSGKITPYEGDTNIFIYPGYQFRTVDALITNLHLPRSTLLMLVCAFGGYENIMCAYQTAVDSSYRFYSYGDAMFIG